MKVKCEVCKAEYSIPDIPSGRVRCAVCGNVWFAQNPKRRSGFLVFIASLCALLAATVFSVAVIITSRRDNPEQRPLIATITSVSEEKAEDGAPRIIVNGTVTNRSDDIYGFPDIVIVLHDAKGAPLLQQKFMPSATLLDAGQSVNFSHTLTGDVAGVKRVSVELINVDMGGKK